MRNFSIKCNLISEHFYRSNNELEMERRMKSKYGVDGNSDRCETKSQQTLASIEQRNAQTLRVTHIFIRIYNAHIAIIVTLNRMIECPIQIYFLISFAFSFFFLFAILQNFDRKLKCHEQKSVRYRYTVHWNRICNEPLTIIYGQ